MGVIVNQLYSCRCDHCCKMYVSDILEDDDLGLSATDFLDREELENSMREEGWKQVDGKWLCPDCKVWKPKDKEPVYVVGFDLNECRFFKMETSWRSGLGQMDAWQPSHLRRGLVFRDEKEYAAVDMCRRLNEALDSVLGEDLK